MAIPKEKGLEDVKRSAEGDECGAMAKHLFPPTLFCRIPLCTLLFQNFPRFTDFFLMLKPGSSIQVSCLCLPSVLSKAEDPLITTGFIRVG